MTSPIFTSPQQMEMEEMERRGMRRQSSFYGKILDPLFFLSFCQFNVNSRKYFVLDEFFCLLSVPTTLPDVLL